MYLTTLTLILACLTLPILSHPTTKPLAWVNLLPLLPRDSTSTTTSSSHPLCTPPPGFTLGYQHCTFASAILTPSLNPLSNTSVLADCWVFDAVCDLVGQGLNVQVEGLVGGCLWVGSELESAVTVNFGDGRVGTGSPVVGYGGKMWDGGVGDCWWDEWFNLECRV
ncbi:uncharacterized protein LY89DRAFT_714931 [Mollisia scopiformis]|uniref:Uncharacterized protein n=1 Tax=Mollisia scopiformis TaxID=149040 RepID=A0A194XPA4_MOLSC|nr:uncharacterized protein LY89DRAFT_714931 [Mollisia scopiformis]KUJ21909.1 hypothetical protein LY89DRAFT_714931 [Mollisia scopiformis]